MKNAAWQSKSVRRALTILESLRDSPRQLSLSEISRKLALPKSTASLLLSTLESMGYLRRENHRYSLTVKADDLGLRHYVELSRSARPALTTIANGLKLTASIAVLEGDQALYVNKVDGLRQPCCDIYSGRRTNLHCTAVGKILLAFVCKGGVQEFLSRHRPIRHTSRTIVLPEDLIEEIAGVKRRGFAVEDQEEELFVHSVATPVFNSAGLPVAALAITGAQTQIRLENAPALAEYLTTMSEQMNRPPMPNGSALLDPQNVPLGDHYKRVGDSLNHQRCI